MAGHRERRDIGARPDGRVPWLLLAAIFALAFALRLAFVVESRSSHFATVPVGDAETVDAWAQDIARGNWLGTEVFFQAPLYPYLLGGLYALVGHDLFIARIVQALAAALACVLVADAARRSFGHRAGLLAGFVLAAYAPAIFYDAVLEKSALTFFELALLLHTLARSAERPTAWRFACVGVLLGCLALTRENAIVLALAIVPWMWLAFRAERVRSRAAWTGALAAGALALLLPVALRNRAVGGEFVLTTTNFGHSLYIGNHAGADGLYSAMRVGRGHARFEDVDAIELAVAQSGRPQSRGEVSRHWRDAALTWMVEHPVDWLALTARKCFYLAHDREWMDSHSYLVGRSESTLLRWLGTFARFGTLLPLALLGLCIAWPRRGSLALWYASIPLLAGSIVLFWIFGRFRLALVPLLAPFAALALVWIATRLRERDWRPLAVAAPLLAIGAAISFWPLPTQLEYPIAGTFTSRGNALQRAGRLDEARTCFETARSDQPDFFAPHFSLGVLCALENDVEGATRNFARAAALEPEYAVPGHLSLAELHQRRGEPIAAAAELHAAELGPPAKADDFFRIGWLRSQLGDSPGAVAAYQRALELRPTFAEAHNNLGYLLARAGRERDAIRHYELALAENPDYATAVINLGWLRARAADPALRDPQAALELSSRAIALLGDSAPAARDLRDAALLENAR